MPRTARTASVSPVADPTGLTSHPKAKPLSAIRLGVPPVYCQAVTGRFIPGYDASYKRDLIAAVTGEANPNGLASFTAEDATARLDARGWLGFLTARQASIAAKAAKKAEKAAAKEAAKQAA